MRKLLFFFLLNSLYAFSQSLYNPYLLYEPQGKMYDIDSLRTIDINFYEPNFNTILDSTYYNDPLYRLPAQIIFNNIILDSVAIRYKGNSSYTKCSSVLKKPYNIDFNEIVTSQMLMGYKKMKLSNSYFDPSFIKELLATKIYQRYLPTYETNLLKVNTQGSYTGLYLNQEAVNKQFLLKHFSEKDGSFFKCDPIDMSNYSPNLQFLGNDSSLYYNSYELKSDHGWKDLINLIDILNNNPSNIESILNVDRVLWYFAVNHAVMNYDTYNIGSPHNYYLYQTKDNLFQIIPWDLSESFINASGPTTSGMLSDPYSLSPSKPLLNTLLTNQLYRKIYTAHLRTIIKESLDTSWFLQNINTLQTLAYPAVLSDNEKGYSTQDFFDNINQVSVLNQWISSQPLMPVILARINDLAQHPEINLSSPSIFNVNVFGNYVTSEVSGADSVHLMLTLSEHNSGFQKITMYDDGQNGDSFANDGIYTSYYQFPFNGDKVKFYIRAFNSQALTLSPERAEYEFYTYSTITRNTNVNDADQKRMIKVIDISSKNINSKPNTTLLYIYDDGTVEKKIILN
tara:strand:- start:2926 stop:4629 length:1704 start_codon:yes stop_codon:yes gene_type:complete